MSYSFDGTNDYLSGSFTSTYADPVTLACFVKMTTHPVVSDSFVCLGNSSSSSDGSYRIETGTADDAWRATSRTTGDSQAEITALNRDNLWTPVVGVFTSDTRRDLYVAAIGNTAQSTDTRAVADVLQFIRVGEELSGGRDFAGLIAEVAIWSKALSTAEITSYLGGTAASSVAAANLIGYWPLSASNATQANLGTDAGGDLTVTNATYNADHPSITSLTRLLKVLVHADAQSDSGVAGVVFQAPGGADITGAKIGEFTGESFEGTLESGLAVLKVAVTNFGGEALTTSDTPVALLRNATYTTGIVPATVIEE